ncbi:hypothetical protein E1B22_01340 [Thermaerobacter sp. FW80]|uniref:hypothetical protein n=1 Tax=Thermaerobacter sp. FW80 TaxID=2546351 RepID=UPI001075806F|nr:hypothetical protein [Thermaerobacter sp. FW80]QBS36740.1 hypothetical protein E1B22_01340 [Thermaerobacter sp. FW80]
MRERLKPLVRGMALVAFAAIAVLWQRRTGGSVAGLVVATAGMAVALVAAVALFARVMSGLQRRGAEVGAGGVPAGPWPPAGAGDRGGSPARRGRGAAVAGSRRPRRPTRKSGGGPWRAS